MTLQEAEDWVTYANRRGTFNVGLRLEAGFALIAWMLARGFKLTKDNRQPYSVKDFMPHVGEPQGEEQEELSFDEAIKAFHKIGTTR